MGDYVVPSTTEAGRLRRRNAHAVFPPERRRAFWIVVGRAMVITAVLLTLYYVVPIADLSGHAAFLKLTISLVVFGVLLVWQTRRVVSADDPEMRVIEALAIILPFFLTMFSSVYFSLSAGNPHAFTERLTHTSALYFVIVVLGTVGFGDISPKSDAARIVVSFQIVFTLVVLGSIVRMLILVAQRALTNGHQQASASRDGEPPARSDP